MMQTYSAEHLLSPANSNLLDEIIQLISHSFTEDPGTKYIFSSSTRAHYLAAVPAYWRVVVKGALLSGASITVIRDDPDTTRSNGSGSVNDQKPSVAGHQEQIQLSPTSTIKAAGVLIPPSGNHLFSAPWTMVRAGLLLFPYHCGWSPTWNMLTGFVPAMEQMSARIYPDREDRYNQWHLLILAAHPASQGQGLGKQILHEFQRVATDAAVQRDKNKKIAPIYLESSSTRSKRLYERVGFVARESVTYGEIRDEDDINLVGDKVLGGRQFGMEWVPKV